MEFFSLLNIYRIYVLIIFFLLLLVISGPGVSASSKTLSDAITSDGSEARISWEFTFVSGERGLFKGFSTVVT